VLTPHQGVFDRTAFDDEPGGTERDDLVLEPIVVERPAVWLQAEPAPATQPSMYLSEPLSATPISLVPSQPAAYGQPIPNPRHTRGPSDVRERERTRTPQARTAMAGATTSRTRTSPTARIPAKRAARANRRGGIKPDAGRGGGITGRGIVFLGLLATFVLAGFDVVLNDELTVFFSVGFILIGMLCALGVRPCDLFTAGVLPALLLAIVMGVFAIAMPRAVSTPASSISNAWVAGLAHHAGGLVSAQAAALLIIGLRTLNKPAKRTRGF
jgi:hypothetical protein